MGRYRLATLEIMRRAASESLDSAPSPEADTELQVGATLRGTPLVSAEPIADLLRQQKLSDLYLFVVDCCLRNGSRQWWREAISLPFTNDAQGIEHLKRLCLQDLLYEAGDVAAFCKAYEVLEVEGYLEGDEQGRYLLDLLRFVRPMLHDGRKEPLRKRLRQTIELPWRKRRAVVSVVIPDDAALSGFWEDCLPSLRNQEGLEAFLERRSATFEVFVHAPKRQETEERLRALGLICRIVCQSIPADLCAEAQIVAGGVQRDWLVGALQCVHLRRARQQGADFHSVNPLGVYAGGFLRELMRASKAQPAVLSTALWINNRGMLDAKTSRSADGSLAISPIDLVTVAMPINSPASCTMFIEGFVMERGPTAQFRVSWILEDHVEVHSTCHEILFVDRQVLRQMPGRFLIRPGAQMDKILSTGGMPYLIAEDDNIVVAEMGHPPGSFREVGGEGGGFDGLAEQIRRADLAKLFTRPVRLAIGPPDRQLMPGVGLQPVRDTFSKLLSQAASPERPSVARVLSAINVLHYHESSEYGLEDMARPIDEGSRLVDLCPCADGDLTESERRVLIRAAMGFDHVAKAIELARQGGPATSFIHQFVVKMMELKAANENRAQRMRRRPFARRPLAVLGSIAWGETFIDKFMTYHVASLLAPGNLPALARKRRIVHSIVTTEAGRQRIVAHPLFATLSRTVEVVFTCFPESFLRQRENDGYNFYYFYGLLDHQSVFLAAALKAELYLLPVDIVLSRDSLANLSRRLDAGADSCSVAGIECDPAELKRWLDGRPRAAAGELDLEPGELLSSAISMPDSYFRSLLMTPTNRTFCRHPRELVWPMPDGLAIHSIFMHPLAVSARLMARPFHPQHENVDFALLPRLLQRDGRLDVVRDAREVAAAQFGAPAAREEFLDSGFSLEAFLDAHRHDYAAHRRCFGISQFFPCDNPGAPASDDYEAEVALIDAALKRYRLTAAP